MGLPLNLGPTTAFTSDRWWPILVSQPSTSDRPMAHAFADRVRYAREPRTARSRRHLGVFRPLGGRSAECEERYHYQRITGPPIRGWAPGAARGAARYRYCWQGWNHPARLQGDRSARRYRHGFSPPE